MEKGGAGNEHGIFFSFFFINSILYTYISYYIQYVYIVYKQHICFSFLFSLQKVCSVRAGAPGTLTAVSRRAWDGAKC